MTGLNSTSKFIFSALRYFAGRQLAFMLLCLLSVFVSVRTYATEVYPGHLPDTTKKSSAVNDTVPAINTHPTDTSKNTSQLKNIGLPAKLPVQNIPSVNQLTQPASNIMAQPKAQMQQAKSLLDQQLHSLNKQPINYNLMLESDNLYQPPPSVTTGETHKFVPVFDVIGTVQAWGIPLNVNYSTNYNYGAPNQNSSWNSGLMKFNFNASQFNSSLHSQFQNYVQLRKNVFAGMDLTEYTQKSLLDKLKREGEGTAPNTPLTKYLRDTSNVNSLLKMDDKTLRQKLLAVASTDSSANALNKSATAYQNKLNSPDSLLNGRDKFLSDSLKALQTSAGNVNKKDSAIGKDSVVSASQQKINAQVDSVANTIADIKAKLHKNGIDANKMLVMQHYMSTGSLYNSEYGSKMLTANPANSLQQIFSNFQSLKLGAFGSSIPGGGIGSQDRFMSGAHATVNTGNVPITLGYGSLNDVTSSSTDANYQNSVYNAPRKLTYLSARLKNNGGNDVTISMIGSFNSGGYNTQNSTTYSLPSASASEMAMNVSRTWRFDQLGNVTVDVSKSAVLNSGQFQNGTIDVLNKKAGLTVNDNFFNALSFGVTQNMDIKRIDASDNFYFNVSGNGYQNPALDSYSGTSMKVGGNFKKSFYDNKLTLAVRGALNNQPLSYVNDDKWVNHQLEFDGRYSLTKKVSLSVKYIDNETNKVVGGINSPVYNFQSFQVDGNATYKIGKNYSISHLTIGEQSFSNMIDLGQSEPMVNNGIGTDNNGAGNMLMLIYTQSLVLSANTLTATVFCNKELGSYQLVGNMVNADMAYQYRMFAHLSMSSGLMYLSNSGIAQQVGIRQGIQIFASKRFDLDTDIDVMKNIIRPLYPDLYAAYRGEVVLKYNLSSK